MSDGQWRLGALQMTSGEHVAANLDQIEQILADTPPEPGDLILLPENFAALGPGCDYRKIAEKPGEGVIQQRLMQLAQKYQITLVGGSLPTWVTGETRCRATSVAFDAQGQLCGHYHKLHLFDVEVSDPIGHYQESAKFIAGTEPKWFTHQSIRVGMSICFDLRFSYLYHWLRAQGCQILLVPAAFTEHTGQAHWLTLLKARAIEQQCYIVAAAQVGDHGHGRVTWGHSCIIDPWGKVVSGLEQQPGICYGTFDGKLIRSLRQRMPLQANSHLQISWSN
ncbi:carbon-nitrogen hydrolase family protein [Celerinatantimonas sp. YJH-8]|uniref:carbon-nitrogen hydrolase family protein n=1 Tax=Celerinatantimonas sp. YJH-8 TaxID=3228714 RepID=UPI0038C4144F